MGLAGLPNRHELFHVRPDTLSPVTAKLLPPAPIPARAATTGSGRYSADGQNSLCHRKRYERQLKSEFILLPAHIPARAATTGSGQYTPAEQNSLCHRKRYERQLKSEFILLPGTHPRPSRDHRERSIYPCRTELALSPKTLRASVEKRVYPIARHTSPPQPRPQGAVGIALRDRTPRRATAVTKATRKRRQIQDLSS